jgi:hypothetical protein
MEITESVLELEIKNPKRAEQVLQKSVNIIDIPGYNYHKPYLLDKLNSAKAIIVLIDSNNRFIFDFRYCVMIVYVEAQMGRHLIYFMIFLIIREQCRI